MKIFHLIVSLSVFPVKFPFNYKFTVKCLHNLTKFKLEYIKSGFKKCKKVR